MTEAVGQLEKGLGLLSTQSSGPARQQQELDLLVALGPALIATSGSGRIVARTGLRMMPTFPRSPLSVGSRTGAPV